MTEPSTDVELSKGPRINEVPEYSTGGTGLSKLEQQFKLDGVQFTLRKPKSAISMHMIRLAEGDAMHTDNEISKDMLNLTMSIIAYIKQEPPNPDGSLRGQALILHRLNDPEDDMDLPDLAAPFSDLINRVFERPTTPRPGSSPKPRASRASGASTRSPRAKTSGTSRNR